MYENSIWTFVTLYICIFEANNIIFRIVLYIIYIYIYILKVGPCMRIALQRRVIIFFHFRVRIIFGRPEINYYL